MRVFESKKDNKAQSNQGQKESVDTTIQFEKEIFQNGKKAIESRSSCKNIYQKMKLTKK
ncbi:unnamed protein product [Paramecium octaurelia]|uniref:Uncharacterized protein n=1 Tax=Paramecium octaurelia TaxID=43137 RepID=A0A8S1S7G3_PAROT|nr:unnamed protein product [Paramecium octaurelia]